MHYLKLRQLLIEQFEECGVKSAELIVDRTMQFSYRDNYIHFKKTALEVCSLYISYEIHGDQIEDLFKAIQIRFKIMKKLPLTLAEFATITLRLKQSIRNDIYHNRLSFTNKNKITHDEYRNKTDAKVTASNSTIYRTKYRTINTDIQM